MMYFLDAAGTIAHCLPERVYQGGAEGCKVRLAAPFTAAVTGTVRFLLPDGTAAGPFTLTCGGKIGGAMAGGEELYGWACDAPAAVTARCGQVRAQFFFRNAAGEQTASAAAVFTVERGVPQPIPEAPAQDAYEALADAVTSLSADLADGLFSARAIYAWNAARTYGAGELVFYPVEGEYGRLLRSLAAENSTPPYTDGALASDKWQAVIDFEALAGAADDAAEGAAAAQQYAQAAQQSASAAEEAEEAVVGAVSALATKAELAAVVSGETSVGSAVGDGDGAEISSTYLKKSDLLDLVYPVGAIYCSYSATPPGTLFGGIWTQIAERFLFAAGPGYTAGSTGGEEEHELSIIEIPAHGHKIWGWPAQNGEDGFPAYGLLIQPDEGRDALWGWSNDMLDDFMIQKQGANVPHNNMPPYLVVYMWRRTA